MLLPIQGVHHAGSLCNRTVRNPGTGSEAEGTESDAYRIELLNILKKIQTDPRRRAETKRALRLLLDNLRMEPHIATPLQVLLALGRLELDDAEFEPALGHLELADERIKLLRAQYPDAEQRWPETRYGPEVAHAVSRSLAGLNRTEEARQRLELLIPALRQGSPHRQALLAASLYDLATIHYWHDRKTQAFPLIRESVQLSMAASDVPKAEVANRLRSLLLLADAVQAEEDLSWAVTAIEESNLRYLDAGSHMEVVDAVFNRLVAAQKHDEADQLLARTRSVFAALGTDGTGSVLYLELLQADLFGRRGGQIAFEAAMAGIAARAQALPESQQMAFALSALRLSSSAIGPVVNGYFGEGQNGGDAYALASRMQRIATLGQSLLPDEHPKKRFAQLVVGTLTLGTLEAANASKAFEDLLSEVTGFPPDQQGLRVLSMNLLSISLAFQGRLDESIFWGKAAINMADSTPADTQAVAAKHEPFAWENQDRANARALNLFSTRFKYEVLTKLLIQQGRLVEAQEILQKLREDELSDSLRSADFRFEQSQASLTGLERKAFSRFYALREEQAQLSAERQALVKQLKDGQLTNAGARRLKEIDENIVPELRKAMARFIGTVQRDLAAHADERVVQNSNNLGAESVQIQRVVDWLAHEEPRAKAVGIQYLVAKDTLSIIVTVPGLPPMARQVAVSRSAVYDAIQAARILLGSARAAPERYRPALQALYSLLIAPLENDLRQLSAHTLMLSLDDRLRLVPFAALMAPNGRFLVEDYAITLYNEASNRALFKAGSPQWRVAAMGLSEKVGALQPLQSVPYELAQVVQAANGGGQVFLNDQFTLATFQQTLAPRPSHAFNVLHVASHFVLSPGQPAASSLYLGRGESISLADMAARQLSFKGFDLVAYSACQSGVGSGRTPDGMEMESLSALTQRQGARAVLGTLWKVSDASVAQAMAAFYGQRGRSAANLAEALRQAQLSLMRAPSAADERFRHPFHWAAFVLAGNWR